MRTLEIKQLVPEASGFYLVCLLHTDDIIEEVRFILDEPTRSSLQTILQSHTNCRYRILPEVETTNDDEQVSGTISVIHARWIRRVSFTGSPSFFHHIQTQLGDSFGRADRSIERTQHAEPDHTVFASSLRQEHAEQRSYIAGLDGLRAIAILAVLAYHFSMGVAPGGFFGVTMFFVLSGYLITNLLVKEWARLGQIDLKRFWIRRARRLLPAMVSMLVVVGSWVFIQDRALIDRFGVEFMAALLYLSNWYYIFSDVSYFEQFETLTPLKHMWSLAIEEQFYLIWPVIVLLGLYVKKRWLLVSLTLVYIAASVTAMIMLYEPGYDASRVYYGTDTRAFSLLIGALLAFALNGEALKRKFINSSPRLLNVAGGFAVLVIICMIGYMNEYEDIIYPVGMLVLSFMTVIAIMTVVHSNGWLSKIMGYAPLRWLGKRSYAIYLWHYPIIILTTPTDSTQGGYALLNVAQFTAVILIAAISWKLIEEPFLKGRFNRSFRFAYRKSSVALSVGVIALVLVMLHAYANTPDKEQYVSSLHVEMNVVGIPQYTSSSISTVSYPEPKRSVASASSLKDGVTVIGDSVILSVESHLQGWMPDIIVDGKVGRQMHEAPGIIEQMKESGELGQVVLIELGANGAFSKRLVDSVIDAVGNDRYVFVVNVRVPRPWQDAVNERLSEVSNKFTNVTLIDWHASSRGNEHYFVQDGVHLTEEGGKKYAELIIKSIEGAELFRNHEVN